MGLVVMLLWFASAIGECPDDDGGEGVVDEKSGG